MQHAVGLLRASVPATGDHFLDLAFERPSRQLFRDDIIRMLLRRRVLFLGNSNVRILLETILYCGSQLLSSNSMAPFTLNYPRSKAGKISFYDSSLTRALSHSGFFVETTFPEGEGSTGVGFCPEQTGKLLNYSSRVLADTDRRFLFCDVCLRASCENDRSLLAFQFTSTPQLGVIEQMSALISGEQSGIFLNEDVDDIIIQIPGRSNSQSPLISDSLLESWKRGLERVLKAVQEMDRFYSAHGRQVNFILMDVIFLKRRDVSYKEPVSESDMKLFKEWNDYATQTISGLVTATSAKVGFVPTLMGELNGGAPKFRCDVIYRDAELSETRLLHANALCAS